VFKGSVINTALVLLLPYSVLWLYFSWRDKKHQLETIQNNNTDSPKQDAFSFRDERGELKLSLKKENLMYIASADNYVKIWYLSKGKLSGFMLRNSLKTIENSINDASIVRCHRSYIVNFDRVKVLKKDKEGICLEFDEEQVPDLPISKTYAERITTLFLKQGNFSA
jgi:DNA-binding LytR/AlgR family response regulator